MKLSIPLLLAIAAGCASGGASLSMNSFYDVPIGASQPEVISMLGEPYSVQNRPDGTTEYEYIVRIKEGDRDLEKRHYLIVMKDGKVVSKKVKQGTAQPYLFDSYQMQTTQVEEPSKE